MPANAKRIGGRVVYYLQTHNRPAQVARLVQVITAGNPDALVLISHDVAGTPLDVPALQALGNVHVTLGQGGYGDFTHLDRYFAAVDWLDDNGIDYDWLENLTGSDYPLRPIAEIEAALAATDSDGYLVYSPVFPDRVPADADRGAPGYRLCRPVDAALRYDNRYWRLGKPSETKLQLMRPLMVINLVQPWVKVLNSYAALGVRQRHTVFGPDFPCYGGSFFCTLRAGAARYVRDYALANPGMVSFFKTLLAPEEVFLHSVLVNSGKFQFTKNARRYIDWTGQRHTHPRTLGPEDLPKMLASDAHWARKLDLERDPWLFDQLDQRVRREPGGHSVGGVRQSAAGEDPDSDAFSSPRAGRHRALSAEQGRDPVLPGGVVADDRGQSAGERCGRGVHPGGRRQLARTGRADAGRREAGVIQGLVDQGARVGAACPVDVAGGLGQVEHLVGDRAAAGRRGNKRERQHRRVVAGHRQRGRVLGLRDEQPAADVRPRDRPMLAAA